MQIYKNIIIFVTNLNIMSRKRLFIDIETSMMQGVFFQLGRKVSIGYEQITQENQIICICYKWEGKSKIYSLDWGKEKNDKKMLEEFVKVANSATELIGHNCDRFDISIIRARCIFHRIPFTPYVNSIDTLKKSRSGIRFNSNRLDYLTNLLLGYGKSETNLQMWKELTIKPYSETVKTLNKMIRYCKRDVKILEEYFKILRPYMKATLSYATDKLHCPECDSDALKINRTAYLPSGNKKVQFLCKHCYTYHTKTIIEPKKK